jgi:hypothetical protein
MIFQDDFTFTKRQLGLLLFVGGTLAFITLLALDLIFTGREGGIGPAQRIALIASVVLILIGLTLIPIKNTPA